MALELSREEYEQGQPGNRSQKHLEEGFQMPQAQDNDREGGLSPALARTALGTSDVDTRRPPSVGSKDQLRDVSTSAGDCLKQAIPLCLPNNCTWNSETGHVVQTEEKRRSLYVVEEALEQLRKIKGPVCVATIAGPCRKGKSYVLSEAFSQPQVFALGHHFKPETMGIWLWIAPGVFKDSWGQDFRLVLLDSEGTGSVDGEGYDDNQIFTLTVLLASILIYNSLGVPRRRDLEELNFIVKLSQSIQVQSQTKAAAGQSQEDSKFFYRTFPFFIWLLRDVTQRIPPDYVNIKDYFLKMVFKVRDSSSAETQDGQKVADSILVYFSGFEAFALPPPNLDEELLKNINDNKSKTNPSFIRGLDQFKRMLGNILTPKKSFNQGELVTGEGLAALVQLYVEALNSPGVIPNIQNAWETFVERKCFEAVRGAVNKYEEVMKSNLKDERPCDNDELRKFLGTALEKGEGCFMTETLGISTSTTEKYLNKLKELLNEKVISWKTRNAELTREFCNSLLSQLKEKRLDPLLRRLQGKEAARISFDEIIGGYNQIKEDYHNSAIGAKDVIAAVFYEFHLAVLKEQKQYLSLLRQLEDYDEELTHELIFKAFQEQERQKLEEAHEQLRQENLAFKKELEMLSRKQNEEREKLRAQMDVELSLQREQMNNMAEANMKSVKENRKLLVQQLSDQQNKFSKLQKANEDNMKMFENLAALVAKQDEEKRRLSEQIELKAQNTSERQEEIRREMEERHNREKAQLEAKVQDLTKELEAFSGKREQDLEKMHAKFSEQTQALKDQKDIVEKMDAKYLQQQEDLRHEMNEKRETELAKLKSKYQAAAETRMQQMRAMQTKIDTVKGELEDLKKPGFFERKWSKVKAFESTVKDICLTM